MTPEEIQRVKELPQRRRDAANGVTNVVINAAN